MLPAPCLMSLTYMLGDANMGPNHGMMELDLSVDPSITIVVCIWLIQCYAKW